MFLESYAAANHRRSTLFIRCRWIRDRTGSEMNASQRLQQRERELKFITSANSDFSSFACGAPGLCSEHLAARHPQRFRSGAYAWLALVVRACGFPYPQSRPVQPTSKRACLPAPRSCHGQCWQRAQHGQTLVYPATMRRAHKHTQGGGLVVRRKCKLATTRPATFKYRVNSSFILLCV